MGVKTHDQIDRRSLALARAVVEKVEQGSVQAGLEQARAVCVRWMVSNPSQALVTWQELLQGSWDDVKAVLLDPSQHGQQLRQSNPFCGVLTPQERWAVYRQWEQDEAA